MIKVPQPEKKLIALHKAAHIVATLHFGISCLATVDSDEPNEVIHNVMHTLRPKTDYEKAVISIAAYIYELNAGHLDYLEGQDDQVTVVSIHANRDLSNFLDIVTSKYPRGTKGEEFARQCMADALRILERHKDKIEEIANELITGGEHRYPGYYFFD